MVANGKVVIIGAPRSGTNMLRDALCQLPGVATWPCDEINPIWRHGHLDYPFDDLSPERASARLQSFVEKSFSRIAKSKDASVVVEKTCANSLRVAYLRALMPEARFVFIYRDGFDATASAIKRWHSSVDWRYTLQKVRFVPLSDVPHYGWRFIKNRLAQRRNADRRLASWGPMTAEVAALAQQGRVAEAAAAQWKQCALRAHCDFEGAGDQVVRVRYEDLVRSPAQELARIVSGIGQDASDSLISDAAALVRGDRTGHGRNALAEAGVLDLVQPIIEPVRLQLGYDGGPAKVAEAG